MWKHACDFRVLHHDKSDPCEGRKRKESRSKKHVLVQKAMFSEDLTGLGRREQQPDAGDAGAKLAPPTAHCGAVTRPQFAHLCMG